MRTMYTSKKPLYLFLENLCKDPTYLTPWGLLAQAEKEQRLKELPYGAPCFSLEIEPKKCTLTTDETHWPITQYITTNGMNTWTCYFYYLNYEDYVPMLHLIGEPTRDVVRFADHVKSGIVSPVLNKVCKDLFSNRKKGIRAYSVAEDITWVKLPPLLQRKEAWIRTNTNQPKVSNIYGRLDNKLLNCWSHVYPEILIPVLENSTIFVEEGVDPRVPEGAHRIRFD